MKTCHDKDLETSIHNHFICNNKHHSKMNIFYRMEILKRLSMPSVGKDVEQMEISYPTDRNVRRHNCFGK